MSADGPSYLPAVALAPQVEAIQRKIDAYLPQLVAQGIRALTLVPYEWMLLDLSLRRASHGAASLHTHCYNEVVIKCQGERCYCHRFARDEPTFTLCKDIFNYLSSMPHKTLAEVPLSADAQRSFDDNLCSFFGAELSLAGDPATVEALVRTVGQRTYRVDLGGDTT